MKSNILVLSKPLFIFSLVALFIYSNQSFSQDKTQNKESSSTPLKKDVDKGVLISELESFIPQLMDSANVPGLSIAVIRDAEIMWHGSFGVKNAETKEAVNDSTVFQAASLSKTVFAYAVLKMYERGELDLDTPLSNYLPLDYIENDERIKLITARMILSHTTGFPNWRPKDGELKIYFTPGERFSYSGEGYVYLQRVMEHLSGKPLNEFIKEHVFEPLEMHNSSYEWIGKYESNLAVGHDEFGNASTREPMTKGNAAYSLYTTALDYAKFMITILRGTGLKKETIREMLSPQIQLDKNCVNCTQRVTTELSEHNSWGLGWGLQNTEEGISFWHWGDQGIFRCYTVAFEKQKIGVVYFTNSANGLSIRNEIIFRTIGGQHPAFSWLHYDAYNSPAKKFARKIVEDGMEAAIKLYSTLKSDRKDGSPVFKERVLNNLGYQLLRIKKVDEAIAVFKLNVEAYPESWNVYDSLGEAYMKHGDKELAIKNYKMSLTLNPDNSNGTKMLEKLSAR